MTENIAAAKARTARPFTMTEGTDAVREFADQGAAYSRDIYEKTKAGPRRPTRSWGKRMRR